ncbi:MAG: glutathione S-transferase N-terminal domain-containing protein [Sphingomonas sp.]
MKLYDNEWAPSPRRVRIYLAEKGINVERVSVDLRRNEHFDDAYLAINPRGMVPALELDDGMVICESAAICRYFEAAQPQPPMFGATPVDVATIESWTRRIENDGYAAAVYVFRNATPRMEGRGAAGKWPPIPLIPELAHRGAIMWRAFVEGLEQRLAGRQWIATDEFSFADITALITIDFAERAARLAVPDDCTNLARWRAAAGARPSASA